MSAFSTLTKSANMLLCPFWHRTDSVSWLTPAESCSRHYRLFCKHITHITVCSPNLMLTLLFNGQRTSEPLWPEILTHFQDFSIDDRIFPVIASRNTTANSCLGLKPPGHIHTKLLFYATEPQPVPAWQTSIIFKRRWPTGRRLYARLCTGAERAFTEAWFQSITVHIVPKGWQPSKEVESLRWERAGRRTNKGSVCEITCQTKR